MAEPLGKPRGCHELAPNPCRQYQEERPLPLKPFLLPRTTQATELIQWLILGYKEHAQRHTCVTFQGIPSCSPKERLN